MPGRATLRMLQRSIRKPKTGTITALTKPPNDRANEAWARSQPISAINGFRNTPKVKASTGPLQTKSPATAPTTTHHGFLKLMHTGVSPYILHFLPADPNALPTGAASCERMQLDFRIERPLALPRQRLM